MTRFLRTMLASSRFLIIFAIAALAPFLCEWIPKIRIPLVVLEITFGLLVGPQVLGWAAPSPIIQILANFGLAFLFFLAGFEVDFQAIRGRPLREATLGWLLSLALCLVVGFGLEGAGLVDSGLIVGAALMPAPTSARRHRRAATIHGSAASSPARESG